MGKEGSKDQKILMKIGLTDAELRDMQTKFHHYAASLNPKQIKSLVASMPTAKQAAKTLGPDITADELEKFIRAHAPHDATVVSFNEECPECGD